MKINLNKVEKALETLGVHSLISDVYSKEIGIIKAQEIVKGKTLPVGTIKKRGPNNYIKTASGWKYHSRAGKSKPVEKPSAVRSAKQDMAEIPKELQKFMDKVPDNPKSWTEGSGELSAIHSFLADYYNDMYDVNYTKDQGYSKTPSEASKRHKAGIRELVSKMKPSEVKDVLKRYSNWLK